MASKTWIKLHCDKWLSGTLRDESPELRGIFADLLALAGSGKYGDEGRISLQNGVGLTDSQVAKLLKISNYLWKKAKKRLQETERIGVNDAGVITILNWKKYQPEYQRQRRYRNAKLQQEVTRPGYWGDKEDREKKTGKAYKVVN